MSLLIGFYILIIIISIVFVIISVITTFAHWYLEWLDYRAKRKYKHVRWLKSIGLLETGLIIYHMNHPYHESFDRIEE